MSLIKHRSAAYADLTAPATGSASRVAVRLRGGAGAHVDRRLKRQKTRQAATVRALREWA